MSYTIAVDFDGTLVTDRYPEIGEVNQRVLDYCKYRKSCGDKLILWTCRTGNRLIEAVKWCNEHGLDLDLVNKNMPENIEKYGGDTRKVHADLYLDDKNMLPDECFR